MKVRGLYVLTLSCGFLVCCIEKDSVGVSGLTEKELGD